MYKNNIHNKIYTIISIYVHTYMYILEGTMDLLLHRWGRREKRETNYYTLFLPTFNKR